MKKRKYGDGAKEYALALREHSGLTYAEITKETGLKEGYIRKLVHDKNKAEVTQKTEIVTPETLPVTQGCNAVADEVTYEKPAKNAAEMQILPKTAVTKQGFFARHFGLMDWVIYTHLVTTSFAIYNALPGVPGAAMAFIYALLLLDALLNVKRAEMPMAAEMAANRVIWMEVLAGVANAHMINHYLWQNLDKLPFNVYRGVRLTETRNDAMEIQYQAEWVNGDWVGILSIVLASFMGFPVCHAVFFAKNAAKEKAKNQSSNQPETP